MSNTTRKLNKLKVTIAIFIIVLLVLTVTGFGRFLYNSVRDRYLASKNFYFTSNLLTTSNKTYEYDNWDGYGVYKIEIDLSSKDNDLQVAKELNYEAAELQNTYDNTTQIDTIDREVGSLAADGTETEYTYTESLDYNLYIKFPKALECMIISDSVYNYTGALDTDAGETVSDIETSTTITRTIEATNHTDKVTIYVKARTGTSLVKNRTYNVEVIAYTKEPYRKNISAIFGLKIQQVGYEIDDASWRDYAILKIRNVNDVASDVTLAVNNPDNFSIDLNDDWLGTAAGTELNSATVSNSYTSPNLAKRVTFKMERDSSTAIRIYKNDDSDTLSIGDITLTRNER